jgi:hypothetical protein
MTVALLLPALLLAACSDQGLVPAESVQVAPDCPVFTMTWRSPLAGRLHIEGELQGPGGELLAPWQRWGEPVDGVEVAISLEVCDAAAFRGEGVADLDLDGQADSWACTRQADGSHALTGEVTFDLDGVPLEVHIAPDPSSDGCGVLAWFPVEV